MRTKTCLLRGTTFNRTYGTHKNLYLVYLPIFTSNTWSYLLWLPRRGKNTGIYSFFLDIYLFLLTILGPIYYGCPVIVQILEYIGFCVNVGS